MSKQTTQLGARIAEARGAAGMSRAQLADLVGIDVSVQGRVERGEVGISAERLLVYAEVLKVSASWLLGETDTAQAS